MQKICPHCQQPFTPRIYRSGQRECTAVFTRRKYCSHSCAAKASRGKKGRGKSRAGRMSIKLLAAQQAARTALGRGE